MCKLEFRIGNRSLYLSPWIQDIGLSLRKKPRRSLGLSAFSKSNEECRVATGLEQPLLLMIFGH